MSDGVWLEGQVKKYLLKRDKKEKGFSFERLYDAKAARGMLPAQTSDYHIDYSMSIYLECK